MYVGSAYVGSGQSEVRSDWRICARRNVVQTVAQMPELTTDRRDRLTAAILVAAPEETCGVDTYYVQSKSQDVAPRKSLKSLS